MTARAAIRTAPGQTIAASFANGYTSGALRDFFLPSVQVRLGIS